ncbi:MAG: lysylphosphatidylglycerol synthase transmembrane domain-containing protein [Candidatus Neomarinimicrobiota bacterium]
MGRYIIGLAISLAALWWAFKGMDWQSFGEAFGQGNLWGLAAASIIMLLAVPIRGWRWRVFLAPIREVPFRVTHAGTFLGFFANNILPFRLGELLRTHFVARQTSSTMSQVFGSVLVERTVDYLNFLVLLALLPLMNVVPAQIRRPLVWVIAIGVVLALVTLWLARRRGGLPIRPGRVKRFLDDLLLAFTSLRRGERTLTIVVTSVGIWLCYLLSIHVTQLAMGLTLTLADSYLLLIATTLVMAVPVTPGYIGTFHAAVILVLVNVLATDQSQAQATAVALHAIGVIPYTLIGAIIYFRSHLQLRGLRARERGSYGEAPS